MKTHKLKSGTELPIISLKGKDYLQVAHRLIWFREECPQWSIQTDLKVCTDKLCVSMATIRNEKGEIMATAHKSETPAGFADYIEKAETGSIGRALAYCGFGTQFCEPDLDEGERIVDAPIAQKEVAPAPRPKLVMSAKRGFEESDVPNFDSVGNRAYVVDFGQKYLGMTLAEMGHRNVESMVNWFQDQAVKDGKPLGMKAVRFINEADKFLRQPVEMG